jgi:hypothetical protein
VQPWLFLPSIVPEYLREDSSVKASVIADLEAIGTSVPLTPMIRDYMEGLSVIHCEFRTCTEGAISGK